MFLKCRPSFPCRSFASLWRARVRLLSMRVSAACWEHVRTNTSETISNNLSYGHPAIKRLQPQTSASEHFGVVVWSEAFTDCLSTQKHIGRPSLQAPAADIAPGAFGGGVFPTKRRECAPFVPDHSTYFLAPEPPLVALCLVCFKAVAPRHPPVAPPHSLIS